MLVPYVDEPFKQRNNVIHLFLKLHNSARIDNKNNAITLYFYL